MKVKIEIDKDARKRMEETIKKFSEVTGKSVEDGINDIARSTARRLAFTVQPYGLNTDIGKKFQESIGHQVDRAWFGVNLGAYPETNSMRDAHNSARKNGVVPKRLFRKEKGNYWRGLINKSERDRYKESQMAKAGRAKGAWIECGNNLNGPKISGVAQWINRHNNKGYGVNEFSGKGLSYKVQMTNSTPYMTDKMQSERSIADSMAYGFKNGFKRLEKIIQKHIEKANA